MDGADHDFPLAAERIAAFRELLETGMFHSAWSWGPAKEQRAGELSKITCAARSSAADVIDQLIFKAPQKLAAFLGAGQPPETVEQIHGWLAAMAKRVRGPARDTVVYLHERLPGEE